MDNEKQMNTLMVDAVMKALKRANIPVYKATDELAEILQLAGEQVEYSKKKKAPETASVPIQERHLTAISDADGAKILKNLESLALEYTEKSKNKTRTFLGDLANALNIPNRNKSSRYGLFKTINENIISIRLSNHNATVSNFDNADEKEGISIVITGAPNTGIDNDGNAHVVEFYYNEQKLRKAEGKPLAEIIRSIKQTLYSGEYKDTTGLALREEVNAHLFKIKAGTIYGWTSNGNIYLTKDGMNPRTLMHEYTHLWSNAMQIANPEGWQSIKDIMREDPLWEKVQSDSNYADIADDEDMLVSEVLSRRSEKNNVALLATQAQKVLREGAYDTDYQANQLLFKMKEALNMFWDWVTTKLFSMKRFQSEEQVSNRVLYDLVNSTRLPSLSDVEKPTQYSIGPSSQKDRITDINIIKQGVGYGIRCKVDGVQQPAEAIKFSEELKYDRIRSSGNKIMLEEYVSSLAEKYFSPERMQQYDFSKSIKR